MNNEQKEAVINCLESILAGNEPEYPHLGLCGNISECIKVDGKWNGVKAHLVMYEVKNLFPQWPEYSGNQDFPVPAPNHTSPENFYYKGWFASNMYEGEYGATRLRLAKFLVDRLKAADVTIEEWWTL